MLRPYKQIRLDSRWRLIYDLLRITSMYMCFLSEFFSWSLFLILNFSMYSHSYSLNLSLYSLLLFFLV